MTNGDKKMLILKFIGDFSNYEKFIFYRSISTI